MQISLVDSLSRRISVAAINGYQQHISPHKGFSCAHRILYGDESCSQYIKQAIAKEGLRVGWLKSRDRFQACNKANQILHSQSQRLKLSASQQKRRRNCNDGCYVDCADVGCGCAEVLAEFADFDCSFIDCSAADCSFITCSGINWR